MPPLSALLHVYAYASMLLLLVATLDVIHVRLLAPYSARPVTLSWKRDVWAVTRFGFLWPLLPVTFLLGRVRALAVTLYALARR